MIKNTTTKNPTRFDLKKSNKIQSKQVDKKHVMNLSGCLNSGALP